jgi:hypothetical protein
VNATITRREQHAIHVTYADATYTVLGLGRYLTSIDEAWRVVLRLAIYRTDVSHAGEANWRLGRGRVQYEDVPDVPAVEEEALIPHDPEWSPRSGEAFLRLRRPLPQLKVERIQLNSPLDITLALEAAGGTGVTVYAMYLLSAVLRDPERIGGWLPRLAAGWHKGRLEASEARLQARRDAGLDTDPTFPEKQPPIDARMYENVTKLVDMSRRLTHPQPVDVIVDRDAETPEDLAEALEVD